MICIPTYVHEYTFYYIPVLLYTTNVFTFFCLTTCHMIYVSGKVLGASHSPVVELYRNIVIYVPRICYVNNVYQHAYTVHMYFTFGNTLSYFFLESYIAVYVTLYIVYLYIYTYTRWNPFLKHSDVYYLQKKRINKVVYITCTYYYPVVMFIPLRY